MRSLVPLPAPGWALLVTVAVFALPARGGAQEAELEGISFALGDPSAPVTVVEYADFACGACAAFAGSTWPTVRSDWVETGRVRWILVPFELGFRNSEEGLRAGLCAARQGRFWQMHDALYARRDEWVGERRPEDPLVAIAADAGVDAQLFRSCYDEDPDEELREAANEAADTDAVRGTPTFFIDGFRVQGALPLEAFTALLAPSGR